MHVLVKDSTISQPYVDAMGVEAAPVTEVTEAVDRPAVPAGAVGDGLINGVTAVAQEAVAFVPEKRVGYE